MSRSFDNRWLRRFAIFTAAVTLFLIWMGGLVTSHGVGMAVPDWPTTYGYNMFLFPPALWTGGIFYEHTHRLVASAVGFLTVVLAVWLWLKEARRWVRWLGLAAVAAVILQGVLGGLRVTEMKDAFGIFHAALAQMFFVLVVFIALVSSRWWRHADVQRWRESGLGRLRTAFALVTVLILAQLVLGASMRHQHAGLAIPDFPLAYGKLWPATDPAAIARYNQQRGEARALNAITAGGVVLQMAHRAMALTILVSVAWLAGTTVRRLGARSAPGKFALVWLGLIGLQVCLGAITIWTNKAADIATAHVMAGALSLATGVILTVLAARATQAARDSSLTTEPVRFDARQVRVST